MNKTETAQLLTRIAAHDRWMTADPVTVDEWQAMLADLTLADCIEAMRAHFEENPGVRVDTGHIKHRVLKKLRLTPEDIARDVRQARARKLVDRNWPETRTLEPTMAEQLNKLRQAEWAALKQIEEQV